MSELLLDGRSLRLTDLAPLVPPSTGADVTLALTSDARERVTASRRMVEETVGSGSAVYGLTTGFGRLKNVVIAEHDLEELQRNLVLSHCCGVGEPMPRHEVRIAQVLRLNGLVAGHSGVRLALCDKLARLFGKQFVPVVPQKGSVGASGDLAPLSHMAAAYMGYGEAWAGPEAKRMDARRALEVLGEEPVELTAKEGLALINGTEIMKATGVVTLLRARNLSKAADILCALTIEGLFGSVRPFDERLAELKHSSGQLKTARNVSRMLEGSEVMKSHEACDRVQDPYSLRCAPQIHGAVKAAVEHVESVLAGEINGVTDNPLLFPDTGEVISAGQFHGQPVSMVLDYLGIALATLANVSERRVEQLVNPDLSHLPAFLTPEPGLNSGLMIAQVAAAALASENKVLAHPASVDTIPTSANQEDHVSMGVTAARKAREICDNVQGVLAIEYLCAAQAREFHREFRAGPAAGVARRLLRDRVPKLEKDRYLHADIEEARQLIATGALVEAVEAHCGELLT